MKTQIIIRTLVALVGLACVGSIHAQTTAAAGTVMVVPVVAATGTFSTEVTVRNGNSNAVTLNVRFYEALGSASPGQRTCSQLALNSQESKQFSLGTQCTLGAGGHFGMLILEDAAAEKINTFGVYSRTQNFAASGFSIEGFPIGNFSSATAGSLGLKRTTAGPPFQTNCFVAALGEQVDYKIQLREPTANAQIGSDITGTLLPYQMIRYLDIFTAAGLPTGDYQNIRAVFDDTDVGEPSFVGFCTVQDNVSFGADFRIARSTDGADLGQRRTVCYGESPCGTIDPTSPTQIPNVTTKYIHWMLVRPPDYIKCQLFGPNVADLEMQLRGPGDVLLAPVFANPIPPYNSAPYTSGGNDQTSFYIYTGERGTINGGTATRWFIDVSAREGTPPGSFPLSYGIDCSSGNGISWPWFRATDTDNF